MSPSDASRSREEIARLGTEAIEHVVRPTLKPEDDGKFIAIDVDTGDHEIHANDCAAVKRLRDRRPTGEIFLARIGYPAAYLLRSPRPILPHANSSSTDSIASDSR